MIATLANIFAVVPLKPREPETGPWDWLTAVAVLVAVVVVLATARRVSWSRLAEGVPRRVRVTLAGLVILGLALTVIALLRDRTAAPLPPPVHAPQGSHDSWPTFMGGPLRRGHLPGSTGPLKPQQRWVFRERALAVAFAASPALADGRVYVGCDNRKLYCLDAARGRKLWTFEARAELFASPVIAGGCIYVGEGLHEADDARLYCLDAASGQKRWAFATRGHIEFSPTLFAGRLYCAAGPDGVYCLDPQTGAQIWQYAGVHVDLSPAVTTEGVYFGSVYGETAFFCVDPRDGRIIWKRPAPTDVAGSPSIEDGRIYFGLGNGNFAMSHARPTGAVACLSAIDGSTIWITKHVKDSVLTAISLWQGGAYFGSRDGHVYCVDAASGRPRWAFDAGDVVLSSPAIANGVVYFGCNDGTIHGVDALSGREIWRYDTSSASFANDSAVMASCAIGDGRLYVGSANGVFFCLDDAPGAARAADKGRE